MAFLLVAACVVSWLYQAPPRLGDDLAYWGLALDLHHGVPGAWNPDSFHDLRWPVWGMCWLLQSLLGESALSYYAEPMVYLGAGAVVVYLLTLRLAAPKETALLAGILFLFHPQLDPVIDRPMPDLSEGFWVAAAFLAWLDLMRSRSARSSWVLAAIVGLCLAVGQANRITGVFAIPVLGFATLFLYPKRFAWLLACGAFALGFVVIEAAIYHSLTGDWLHSLHANLGARGRKGTEEVPLWMLPIRFVPLLFRQVPDILFSIAGIIGIGVAALRYGKPGRALATYVVIYLLTYSCALQSLDPPRPLVRDGERFLGSLAYPLSICTALTLTWLVGLTPPRWRANTVGAWLWKHPLAPMALLVCGLVFLSNRGFRGPNYLHEIADYTRGMTPQLRVLSHPAMRQVCFLADPSTARQMNWTLRDDLLDPSPDTLALASASDQIWFNRKWIWTSTRKDSEYGREERLPAIAPWLRPPLDGWSAERAIAKGDVPDFVFLGRRDEGDLMTAQAPDGEPLRELLLPSFDVPHTWTRASFPKDTLTFPRVPIAPWLRGRTLFLALEYSSDGTEPARAWLYFYEDNREILKLTIKPYLFDESSADFQFLTVPATADSMELRLRVEKETERISIDDFQLLMEPAPAALPEAEDRG